MDIKIIATLMTFILGTLILLSRSWSKRERTYGLLEAEYAEELLKLDGPVKNLEELVQDSKLSELAKKLALARGQSEAHAMATLRSDLEQILAR